MGLDMYLRAKRYVGSWREEDKKIADQIKAIEGLGAFGESFHITCEALYWRKANHIHQWFVNHVQDGTDDCGTYWVSREKLRELITTCKAVLADHSLAPTLLPTQAGFFFGGTDYDDWYYDDLRSTAQDLERVLELPESHWDFEYHSSW